MLIEPIYYIKLTGNMNQHLSQERKETRSYVSKLAEVMGVKGTVVLLTLLAMTSLGSLAPSYADGFYAGALLSIALLLAVLADKWLDIGDDQLDRVGIAMFVVAALYTLMKYLEALNTTSYASVEWLFALAGGGLVLAAVISDYWSSGEKLDDYSWKKKDTRMPELLRIDLVGFLVAEILIVYSMLRLGGYNIFAHSPAFPAFVFVLSSSFFALVAGYTVITREIEVSGIGDEFHELLIGVIRGLKDVEDEEIREDIAERMRLIAENVRGVTLTSVIKDRYGGIPVVLPTFDPVAWYEDKGLYDVLDDVKSEGITGYVVYGDNVILLRNGNVVKYFVDGEYGEETDELDEGRVDAEVFELPHSVLNELQSITPRPYEDVEEAPEPEEREKEEKESEEVATEDKTIDVGGNEVDIEEMFEKADEIMEELSE